MVSTDVHSPLATTSASAHTNHMNPASDAYNRAAVTHHLQLEAPRSFASHCAQRPFHRIVAEQARNAFRLHRGVHPPGPGICISLRNNTIIKVTNGDGFVHPTRREQFVAFFHNLCARRRVPDSDININLDDIPISGTFGFCRSKQGAGEKKKTETHLGR